MEITSQILCNLTSQCQYLYSGYFSQFFTLIREIESENIPYIHTQYYCTVRLNDMSIAYDGAVGSC